MADSTVTLGPAVLLPDLGNGNSTTLSGNGTAGTTTPGSNVGLIAGAALPPMVVTAKRPAITSLLPNPLHQFASYTYSWSLWWLSIEDYNELMLAKDPLDAAGFKPKSKSYCVAEDSGRFNDRRVPSTAINSSRFGLNYNIQNVSFTTTIAPNKRSRSSNIIDGKLTILEPYGVTFIDTLVDASFDTEAQVFKNYTQQPYMLQLDFFGYDDQGNQISDARTALYRKRFPIKFLAVDIDVGTKGAQYTIDFVAAGGWSHYGELSNTPVDISFTASTVKEFLDEFANKLNKYNISKLKTGSEGYADSYKFEVDEDIGKSSIVNPDQSSLKQSNPKVQGIQFDKKQFTIAARTPIIDVITRVMIQSKFLTSDQGIGTTSTAASQATENQTDPLTLFKTTTKLFYKGMDSTGALHDNAYDKVRSQPAFQNIYYIDQYTTWKAEHPGGRILSDSRNYTVKSYNYLYTGQSIDILDFKIKFDMTYYTAIQHFNAVLAGQQATVNTLSDIESENVFVPPITPTTLGSVVPQLNTTRNLTPSRYRVIPQDPNLNVMGTEFIPQARVSADVVKSMFSGIKADMINLDLKIVGDPTLLKQDDWLYAGIVVGTQSQYDYAQQYGHIRTDNSDVVVEVTINTPIDLDLDLSNAGLVTPPPRLYPSLFSGQYRIVTIENNFADGQFTQTLSLVRFINTDLIDVFGSGTNRQADGTVAKAIKDGSTSGVGTNGNIPVDATRTN